uniref:Secretagogin, EF-hand calcium binding protein n=1 Tax=Gorilla gorilla gorilla TaxID=9595 RepID=A0A2I2YWN9_GORGO
MDSSREPTPGRLDAAGFWQVWLRFDADGHGHESKFAQGETAIYDYPRCL